MTKTIIVNNEKIIIKSKIKTRQGNHCGYTVNINGKNYFYFTLNEQEARDICFTKWVKENKDNIQKNCEKYGYCFTDERGRIV